MTKKEKLEKLINIELEYRKKQAENPGITKAEVIEKDFGYDRSRYYQLRMEFGSEIKKLYGSIDNMIDQIKDDKMKEEMIRKVLELTSNNVKDDKQEKKNKMNSDLKMDIGKDLKIEIMEDIRKRVPEMNAYKELNLGNEKKNDIFRFLKSKWLWIILIGVAGLTVVLVMLKRLKSLKKKAEKEMRVSSKTDIKDNEYDIPPEF